MTNSFKLSDELGLKLFTTSLDKELFGTRFRTSGNDEYQPMGKKIARTSLQKRNTIMSRETGYGNE